MPSTLNNRQRKARHKRDGGHFTALPDVVVDSAAFTSLTGQQTKLLIDISIQFKGDNNGKLSASWTYLSEKRGWTSKAPIRAALTALEERSLIFCTRKGKFPKTPAWYAVTWHPLDHHPDMECSPQCLPRGAYAHWSPIKKNDAFST